MTNDSQFSNHVLCLTQDTIISFIDVFGTCVIACTKKSSLLNFDCAMELLAPSYAYKPREVNERKVEPHLESQGHSGSGAVASDVLGEAAEKYGMDSSLRDMCFQMSSSEISGQALALSLVGTVIRETFVVFRAVMMQINTVSCSCQRSERGMNPITKVQGTM